MSNLLSTLNICFIYVASFSIAFFAAYVLALCDDINKTVKYLLCTILALFGGTLLIKLFIALVLL